MCAIASTRNSFFCGLSADMGSRHLSEAASISNASLFYGVRQPGCRFCDSSPAPHSRFASRSTDLPAVGRLQLVRAGVQLKNSTFPTQIYARRTLLTFMV